MDGQGSMRDQSDSLLSGMNLGKVSKTIQWVGFPLPSSITPLFDFYLQVKKNACSRLFPHGSTP